MASVTFDHVTKAYAADVVAGTYPDESHTYH